MENNREHLQSHEEREAQTLVERIEKKEASHRSRQRSRNEENARRLRENSRQLAALTICSLNLGLNVSCPLARLGDRFAFPARRLVIGEQFGTVLTL
jgi:hypothetical protein